MTKTWQGMKTESERAGINLIGTPYHGMSAAALRQANPALADQWVAFLRLNTPAIVAEVTDRITRRK